MPILGQRYGVTGKRTPSSRVDIINEQRSYLPAIMREKGERELAERGLELDRERLQMSRELGERELGMMEEASEEAERRGRVSNVISGGKLAADIYFGEKEANVLEKMAAGEDLTGGAPTAADLAADQAGITYDPSTGLPTSGLGETGGGGLLEFGGNVWDSIGLETLGAGVAGYTAGQLFADEDTSDLERFLIGGAAGGATEYFAGEGASSLYDYGTSILAGGIGGLF